MCCLWRNKDKAQCSCLLATAGVGKGGDLPSGYPLICPGVHLSGGSLVRELGLGLGLGLGADR